MQKIIHKSCSPGLILLLLAMLVNWNPLSSHTYAHAQATRAVQVHAAARSAQGMVLTGALRYGKVIIVDLAQQHLYAYENGQEVFDTPVLTGQPALPTPVGTYHIFKKLSPTTFHSHFPRRSRFWYPPTHINYALEFRGGGYYLHDSWWHTVYGAGTEYRHYDPQYGWQTGSHGCVSMPLDAAQWLYSWAPIGTVVRIMR